MGPVNFQTKKSLSCWVKGAVNQNTGTLEVKKSLLALVVEEN